MPQSHRRFHNSNMFCHESVNLSARLARAMWECICIYIYIYIHVYVYMYVYLFIYSYIRKHCECALAFERPRVRSTRLCLSSLD